MLLTIHNLPSTTRYADVKSLLQEKCGLTDVIVDNLVNEGNNKRVTVGLASEDDGSFVVRKLNGLFINGDQLYIEDKRRTTADQPYRPSGFDANVMQGQGAMVPSAFASWNQTAPAVPYVALIDQNLAYSGYVGVPQVPQIPQYTLPQPVPAEMPGYTGYQGGGYPPNQGVRTQDPEDQRRSARDRSPAAPRRDERKRRHSPERRPPPSKRSSRFDNHKAPSRREPSPPRRQRPQEEQRFREPEQFPRNQHSKPDARPRDNHDRRPEPQWEKSRWDDPNPRTEPERERGNERRAWESQPNQPEPQWQEEPRQWDTPKPQWEAPSKQWDMQPKSQWDDQPKPQWDAQPKPRWDIPPKPQWETRPAHPVPTFEAPRPQWDAPPQPQWEDAQPEPQWDPPQNPQWNAQSEPQWERDSLIPVENIHFEWYNQQASDRLPREDVRDFRPPQRSRNRDSRPRDQGFNKQDSDPVWRKRPENSFSSRQGRPEETRRDRPRSKGRQESDWRDEQPIHPRDRSDNCNKPYGRQNDFSEPKRQVRPEKREAPKVVPRFDKQGLNKGPNKPVAPNKFNAANNTFAKEKNTYPPVSLPQKKPFDPSFKKPQTLRSMINKDQSNRGQATALIAKTVFSGNSKGVEPTSYSRKRNPSDLESFSFKQLKICIKSRIDVLLGEELSLDMADVVKRYRQKFPITEDKTLMVQIREKSLREFEEKEKQKNNEEGVGEVKNEKDDSKKAPENNAVIENKDGGDTSQEGNTNDKDKTTAAKVPLVPPNMPKAKSGKPLTERQAAQQVKLQRKWEFEHDDLYSLEVVDQKALNDEMRAFETLFTDELKTPADKHEVQICNRIASDSLHTFNKTIRLNITKRFLNIPSGLTIRIFASGKLPKKTAIKEYLKKYRIESLAVKKSPKGDMAVANLSRFEDYDALCQMENDVIGGIPVTFKAMHLVGPPSKLSRNQVKELRARHIQRQTLDEYEDVNFAEGGDTDEGGEDGEDEGGENGEDKGNLSETPKLAENDDVRADLDADIGGAAKKDGFTTELNIGDIKEEDLEDF